MIEAHSQGGGGGGGERGERGERSLLPRRTTATEEQEMAACHACVRSLSRSLALSPSLPQGQRRLGGHPCLERVTQDADRGTGCVSSVSAASRGDTFCTGIQDADLREGILLAGVWRRTSRSVINKQRKKKSRGKDRSPEPRSGKLEAAKTKAAARACAGVGVAACIGAQADVRVRARVQGRRNQPCSRVFCAC